MNKPVIAERRCKYCGKYFTPTRNTVRYCSQECLELYHRDLQKQKRISKGRRPVKTTRCVICNKRFEKKSPTHTICSPECAKLRKQQLYQIKKAIPKKPDSRANYIECNRCGKIFKSWDRTKNRRCARCQYEIEEQSVGVDINLLELGR